MNKKLISLFLLASMAAASLASCGGDGSGNEQRHNGILRRDHDRGG